MKTARVFMSAASLFFFAACGGSDGAPGPAGAAGANGQNGAAGQNGAPGQNGANVDAGSPPTHAPAGITFFDREPATGAVSGTIVVQHAAVESDVTSYAVYYGKSATAKLDLVPIFAEPASGADVTFPLTLDPIPAGASFLLAVAQNAGGESAVVATHLDAVPTHVDISAGAPGGSGISPSLAIDEANGKVLVVTDDGSNGSKPSLFRCNLDGTSCAHTDISAGAGTGSGSSPSLAIDAANGKLLAVTEDDSNSSKPSLFRCNLDGTSCAYIDISAGTAANSGFAPSIAIDATNAKLLVATEDGSNAFRPGLFRCNLDGTSCAHIDISAGAAASSGYVPSLAIDAVHGKLLVATTDTSNGYRPALFRCNLDGTSCLHFTIPVGTPASSGFTPSLAIDAASGKLLLATDDGSNNDYTALFRSNLDGTSSARFDISDGTYSGYDPSIAVDAVNGKLFLATDDTSHGDRLGLFRCNLDGTSCTHSDMSGGAAASSGLTPSLAIDAATGQPFIATRDGSNDKLALFFLH